MALRQRVVVYVERNGELLVLGGVLAGEVAVDAAVREVREETGLKLRACPVLRGTHGHLGGLGRPSRSHLFRVDAPEGALSSWEHVVAGHGEDAGLVFRCRFAADPMLLAVQAAFRPSPRTLAPRRVGPRP